VWCECKKNTENSRQINFGARLRNPELKGTIKELPELFAAYLGVVASAGGNVYRRIEGPGRLEIAGDGGPLREICGRAFIGRCFAD
jgi:hypothetical protein